MPFHSNKNNFLSFQVQNRRLSISKGQYENSTMFRRKIQYLPSVFMSQFAVYVQQKSQYTKKMSEGKLMNKVLTMSGIKKAETSTASNEKSGEKTCKGKDLNQKFRHHPAMKYIMETMVDDKTFCKFSLQYSVSSLQGPSGSELQKQKINLNGVIDSKDKILLLDLDQTLIHVSSSSKNSGDITLQLAGQQRSVNIRPYCQEFLKKMSNIYNVYVFTAATLEYAQPIIDFLNRGTKTIQGILHRNNCLETGHGLYIKDLRIIKNKDVSKIILVDNFAHSFGLQLENGVPILEFRDNKNDQQLKGLQKLLIKASEAKDVRKFLSENLKLKQNLKISEAEYINSV